MITKQHIEELEERLTRSFHTMDVVTVNLIRGEVAWLKKMLESAPMEKTAEMIKTGLMKEEGYVEDELVKVAESIKIKKKKVEPTVNQEVAAPQALAPTKAE